MEWQLITELAFWTLILAVPFLVSKFSRKKFKRLKYLLFVVTISSFLMSGAVAARTVHLKWQLEQQTRPMDRNGDGVLSPDEEATWTPEEKRASLRRFSDSGRIVFAAIIFPAFSVIYSLLVGLAFWSYHVPSNGRKSQS